MLHLFLLICFTLALYRNETINYLILTLLCELNGERNIRRRGEEGLAGLRVDRCGPRLAMTEDGMPPRHAGVGDTSTFFAVTLVLWAMSVGF